jgi:GNAT superfamily N-acetyltransferase
MNIEIKKLTPDLAEDYVHFFDITPHNFNERICYCVTWRSDDSYVGDGDHWFPTREERRERALQFVKNGSLQGYLAYHDNDIVGWCNANADCQNCINYLRTYWPIEEYNTDIRVKSIFCFVIAPEMQRKGVATLLLEHVCKDARDDGYDFVEAYVNKEFTETDHEFRGPMTMYEKCGFSKCGEHEGKIVMRKAVKE